MAASETNPNIDPAHPSFCDRCSRNHDGSENHAVERNSDPVSGGPFLVGDIVRARPWESGRRTAPRRALVVGEALGMPLLWFYAWGEPEQGRSIQPIKAIELVRVSDLWEASIPQLWRWEKAAVAEARHLRAIAPLTSRLRLQLVALRDANKLPQP